MKRKSILFVTILALVAFVASANTSSAKGDFAIGSTIENFSLIGTDNKQHSFDDLKGKNGAIIVFLSAQCPVVKMYDERINKIAAEYKAKGINFIGVNSNSTEDFAWVKSHSEELYKFPVLIDKGNVLADKLGATVTPEFYQFDADGKLVFHGPADNNRKGDNITENYLRDALNQMLSKKEIKTKTAKAFGCTIKRVKAEE